MVHDKWLSRQVWSKLLLIHHEFSQFFVAHSSDEVRDRRVGARSIADVLKSTWTVYKLRCDQCHISKAPPTPSPNWDCPSTCTPWSGSLQPCRMPQSVSNGQFPKPSSVGCQIFPPHMSPAEATMLPVAPRVTNISAIAMHRAPIPLAADCSSAAARRFDRRIVSFEL